MYVAVCRGELQRELIGYTVPTRAEMVLPRATLTAQFTGVLQCVLQFALQCVSAVQVAQCATITAQFTSLW